MGVIELIEKLLLPPLNHVQHIVTQLAESHPRVCGCQIYFRLIVL
jgi:hypothetical protein